MYPIVRALTTLLRAKNKPTLDPHEIGISRFWVRPWDLDVFMEVNNGRQMTLFELGRWDFAVRTGLTQVLKAQKWGLVVAGSSVRFRKRIRFGSRVEVRTQMAGLDGRWVFMSQSFWVNGEPCSHALFRTAVTENGRPIDTDRVLAELNTDTAFDKPEWVDAWIASDNMRPWPPQDME